ncbi:MAG TPA: gamma-glutamyltransferase [Burkholderiaceae bacterium]|nr:gamma-glutamyltransferase [Burkholderiaceae bacterium]
MSLLYCLFRAVSAAAAISVLLVGPVPAKESLELPLIPGLSTPEHTVDNAADHLDPEQATGRHEHSLVHGKRWMVSAANPLASQAGANMLRKGGSAVDAAIAMQWVLNLVEPQSSGLGGGAFALLFDASEKRLTAWDGRETAPSSADAQRFMSDGKPMSFAKAVNSGLSVGVPGLLRMLHDMHQEHGRLPWPDLAAPAIQLAESGFPVSDRLHGLLASNDALRDQAEAGSYFYDSDGQPWPVGHKLTNPALADTLRRIADQGPEPFYEGQLARDMAAAVAAHSRPGDLTVTDIAAYKAQRRDPLCMPYKKVDICGMPAPSSGPLAVMQILGVLSHTPMATAEPDSLEAVHYFAEAGRLAYADRNHYLADPDFADVPQQALIAPDYLRERAALIQDEVSMGRARPGVVASPSGARNGADATREQPSTTHMVAVDEQGNVISLTSSIESAFGSKILVNGYLLNNQLTDFSLVDKDDQGNWIANRVEPGKRPRSSMAPMIIMKDDKPLLAIGSPGGPAIINYVANALMGFLDWGKDIQQAIDAPHRGSRNGATELEAGSSLVKLSSGLEEMGHEIDIREFPSGLQAIAIMEDGLEGAADPRREGRAIGR